MVDDMLQRAKAILAFVESDLNGDFNKGIQLFNVVLGVMHTEHQLEDHRQSMQNPEMMKQILSILERAEHEHDA